MIAYLHTFVLETIPSKKNQSGEVGASGITFEKVTSKQESL